LLFLTATSRECSLVPRLAVPSFSRTLVYFAPSINPPVKKQPDDCSKKISQQVGPASGAVYGDGRLQNFHQSPVKQGKKEDDDKFKNIIGLVSAGKEEGQNPVQTEMNYLIQMGNAEEPPMGEVIARHQAQNGDKSQPEK